MDSDAIASREPAVRRERILEVRDLRKAFTLHQQGGVAVPALSGFSMDVNGGECVVLQGGSGAGKSTVLRCILGNYLVQSGAVRLKWRGEWIDLAQADPRTVLMLRREAIGYVSQFLRAVPRVPALEVVAEPLRLLGVAADAAAERARVMLRRLDVPERLWGLPPVTFSGGEQQRVNIARGFVHRYDLLLLDEPTAALDRDNRERVVALVDEARAAGSAVVGIFHDDDVGARVATRHVRLNASTAA